jgi:probable rRNA maturation factor
MPVIIENCSGCPVPDTASIQHWVKTTLAGRATNAEINLRIVDEEECSELYARYRGGQGTTNVLSFAADLPSYVKSPLLGDIAICAAVVIQEAREQKKQPGAHWAHMVVHGTLHLLGYGHATEAEANVMEALEIQLLKELNFPSPYNVSKRDCTESNTQ